MITCRVCKLEKDENEFYWKVKSKEKKQSECKECTKKMVANHYSNNKEYYKNNTKQHRIVKQDWYKKHKNTLKCEKCSENHPSTLDFHHKDSNEKIKDVSTLMNRNWGLDKIQEEIDKCIILCSNCHRKFHYLEKENNIIIEDFLQLPY